MLGVLEQVVHRFHKRRALELVCCFHVPHLNSERVVQQVLHTVQYLTYAE